MLRKILIISVLVSLCFSLTACKKESEPAAEQAGEDVVVKSAAEYKAEAEKEITSENMDAELEALEKAVDAEVQQ